MGLRGRLRKLEDRPEVKRCPECKLLPEGPDYIAYAEEDERPESEHCPRCSRPLYFFIRVVYES